MSKLRKSARGQECTLRVAGYVAMPCEPTETTVLCHAPPGSLRFGGKGLAMKVDDTWAAYGCGLCHALQDSRDNRLTDDQKLDGWNRGIYETQHIMREMGLIGELK